MTSTITDWGFMSQPLHEKALVEGAPWRDNAFLAFWDVAQDLFGVAHFSTSPNAGGRRARLSLVRGGRAVEVIEPLEPASFRSESLEFDLERSVITVDHSSLTARLEMAPRFVIADYSPTGLIPDLVEGASLRHYQRFADVTGEVASADESPTPLNGTGFRDRTWGPRDESAAFSEYLGVCGALDDVGVTVMKFAPPGGPGKTHGFLLREDRSVVVHTMDLLRDGAGLISSARLVTEDGEELTIRMARARGGFWVPMGDGGPPPVMSAYDDASDWFTDGGSGGGTGGGADDGSGGTGRVGAGFCEQGVLRQL